LLIETAAAVGLDQALSEGLRPWRGRRAVHDPGKVLLDLAVAVALGGDCLADVAVVRAQPDLFGDVASDPTVSRLVAALATDAPAALAAVRQARAQARERVWQLSPPVGTDGPIVVDLDATIVLAHSEKEGATPTWRFDAWVNQEQPLDDLRVYVLDWIFTRSRDPYADARRVPGFADYWQAVIPRSEHFDDNAERCAVMCLFPPLSAWGDAPVGA